MPAVVRDGIERVSMGLSAATVRTLLLTVTLMLSSGLSQTDTKAQIPVKPFSKWTLAEAVSLLNNSPWAHQETFTRIIGGIGSGVSGEKEIYSTFFVRFLSARPIREAYARALQIRAGYDRLNDAQRKKIDLGLSGGLSLDVSRWIVVSVSFRSNDANLESTVRRTLELESQESMKTRAFLSTARHSQIPLEAYFSPSDDLVGAKFVFPRMLDDGPAISERDEEVTFELDIPAFDPDLRIHFAVADMVIGGALVL
jgi:hypothetical protein